MNYDEETPMRTYRQERGWTQEHLADLMGDKQPNIRIWGLDGTDQKRFAMVLRRRGVHFATLYVDCKVREEQIVAIKQLLLWAHNWLDLLGEQSREKAQRFDLTLDLLERSASQRDLSGNAYTLCCSIVDQLPFTQAVFCTLNGRKVVMKAVSKLPQFDQRVQSFAQLTNLLKSYGSATTETTESDYRNWLIRNQPGTDFFIFPMEYDDLTFGFLVVYFSPPLTQETLVKSQLKLVLRFLAPIYHKMWWMELMLLKRWNAKLKQLIHQQKASVKMFVGSIGVVGLIALGFAPVSHSISAKAHIEGKVQRAVVAPDDGYLEQVLVRAGQPIAQGELMVKLDEKSILLEIQRWQNEKLEYEREYNRYLTAMDHGQLRVTQAKIAQADAKLSIYQEQLQKSKILAPIAGVIIKGDLSRAIGAPIKKGQVLFELAPINDFKLVLLVKEQDIRLIQSHQTGLMRLSAQPENPLAFEITSVSSVYQEGEGNIVYRVEAQLIGSAPSLRPGMSGFAKVDVGKQPWLITLFTPLWDKVTLFFWKYF